MNSTTPAEEVNSGDDDDDDDDDDDENEEAHEVDEDLDFTQTWRDEDEMWFDLHPPKHNMIKYQHEVRELPSIDARVIDISFWGRGPGEAPRNSRKGGGLNADGGKNWLFCRFHKVNRDGAGSSEKKSGGKRLSAEAKEWGWALINEGALSSSRYTYLARAAGVDDEEGVPLSLALRTLTARRTQM